MRGWSLAGSLGWALFSAVPASGLSLVLEGPTSGALLSGELGAETPLAGGTLTLEVSLDESVSLLGFDLLLSWDTAELDLLSATDQTGLGLDTLPGSSGLNERIAGIEFSPVTTTALFTLDFAVLAVIDDGAVDFSFDTNGAGLAPSSLVLDSGAGASLIVPEPRLPIFATALVALGLGFARRAAR